MRIVLFGAIGLAVGLGAGTGVSAFKQKKVLTAELMARQDSIAAAQAESLGEGEMEGSEGAHGADTSSTSDQTLDQLQGPVLEGGEGSGEEGAEPAGGVAPVEGDTHGEDPSVSGGEAPGASGEGDPTGAPEDEGSPEEGVEAAPPDTAVEARAEGVGQAGVTPVSALPASLPAPTAQGGASGSGEGGADEEGPLRLAKIFGAMDPDEAAKVLENLEDTEVQVILRHISERKVAAILSNFEPARAATLSRVVMGLGPGGSASSGGTP